MGRFSPGVVPAEDTGLRDFGRTIARVLDDMRQRKREKRSDELADAREKRLGAADDRDRLRDEVDLYDAGYRTGTPPAESNPDAEAIQSQRGNQVQTGRGASATPPPQQRGNATQAQAPIAPPQPTFSPIRQAGMQFYTLPGGQGYIDPSQTPEGRKTRREDEVDTRDFEQDKELEGVRHGHRMTEKGADRTADREDDATDFEQDKALEGLRQRGQQRLEAGRTKTRIELERERARLRGQADGAPGDPASPKTLDKRFGMVGSQINNAEQALAAEGTALDEGEATDSLAYHDIAAELDSLRGVHGQIASARGGDSTAVAEIRRNVEKQAITEKRQRALNMGLDPGAVEAAYQQDLRMVEQKYGTRSSGAANPGWHPPMALPRGQ